MFPGKPAYEMCESHPDWAPSLHLGHSEIEPTEAEQFARLVNSERRRTTAAESRPKMDETAQREAAPLEEDIDEEAGEAELCEPPAKRSMTECGVCEFRRAEIDCLLEENRALKLKLDRSKMDEHFLKDDDEKVMYYTGLPHFEVVKGLLACVQPHLPQTGRVLSPFQMLFLTLMRLRLDLPIQHVAHLFHVDSKTVPETFSDTINVLNARLRPLLRWPGRDALHGSMPPQFVEAFGKRVAIILDCFEINTQRPSNLETQTQSFIHGQNSTTIKYLLGVTPQGSVSFVSKGWGGHPSDEHVTENSGILDKLLPGDLVLAGHGFDVRDGGGLMCAEVKTPEFTKERCQLEAKDAKETQKLSHLQIHVKRVSGNIHNKYAILAGKVPISMLVKCEGEDMTFLDKIVTVCSALTNMCPSVTVQRK